MIYKWLKYKDNINRWKYKLFEIDENSESIEDEIQEFVQEYFEYLTELSCGYIEYNYEDEEYYIFDYADIDVDDLSEYMIDLAKCIERSKESLRRHEKEFSMLKELFIPKLEESIKEKF